MLRTTLLIVALLSRTACAQTEAVVPYATPTAAGTVRPDPVCFHVAPSDGTMTYTCNSGQGTGQAINPTLKITVNPGASNIVWTGSNQYSLAKFHNIAPDSTLNAALIDDGTDYGFKATRAGPIRITGQVFFVLPEFIALANAQYVLRWFKNGPATNPCSDGSGVVFSPDIGAANLVNGSLVWAWMIPIQAEDVAAQGDIYRPCLYATLAGNADYIDALHSRFTFVEEGP